MVAFARSIVSTASLSSVYHAPSLLPDAHKTSNAVPQCNSATTVTVYEYDYTTVYNTPIPTADVVVSDYSGHGGPYDNPYNDVPFPVEWPGYPSPGQILPPPMPPPSYEYGGSAKNEYEAPAWIPKGYGKLDHSLPEGKQNGDSYWGELHCPHLPLDGLPGPHDPSVYPTSVPSQPYPTEVGSVSYSVNGNKTSTYFGFPSVNATKTIISGYPSNTANSTTRDPSTASITSTPVPSCPSMPDTGVTRTYDLHVAYQTIAPDGITRNGLTFNGQFPGPLVEANWGDWILFRVSNDLTDEGTAIHAHGLSQKGTPWYDGVPAVDQCPIVPGGKFDMLFRADRYGTSWYHSHFSAQYSGGAHGPMIIYGPKHAEYDIDLGPVVVEDWFHPDYYALVRATMTQRIPASNNVLINGKNNYPCANTTLPCVPNAGVSKFKFESGKKHLLRLINAGTEGVQKFSIDNHTLTVVANDFVPIEPYDTNVVTLGVGQRADVIVEATGEPGDAYWMRSNLGTFPCSFYDGVSPGAVAAIYYEDADTDSVPASTSDVTADQRALCKNDALEKNVPICKIPVEEPSTTATIELNFRSNGTNFVWYVNNSTYRGNYNDPILPQVNSGDFDYEPEWNVYNFGSNETVRVHLVNRALNLGHPMHLHGHDFHVLAEGFGEWDGTVINPENTVRRDVYQLQNAHNTTSGINPSYIVIQWVQDNPGVWPLHCHLAWHVSQGLFMNIVERPDDIQTQTIPDDLPRLCREWDAYSSEFPPNQIDSGL